MPYLRLRWVTVGCVLLTTACGGRGVDTSPLRIEAEQWHQWAEVRGLDPQAPTPDALRRMALSDQLIATLTSLPDATRSEIDAKVADLRRAWSLEVVERRLKAEVDLSQEAVAAAFAAEPGRWQRVEQARLSHLALRKEGSRDEARDRISELREQLIAGADFAELARRHSQAQNAFRGGLIGWTRLERLAPPVAEAIESLEPGEISEPVETTETWVLLRLDETKSAQPMTLEEATPRVRLRLHRQSLQRALDALDAEAVARWPSHTTAEVVRRPASEWLRTGEGSVTFGDLSRFIAARYPFIELSDISDERVRELAEELATELRRERYAADAGWLADEDWVPRERAARARQTFAALVEAKLESPSASELRAAFERHRERLGQEERVKLSTLRVDFDPSQGRAALSQLEGLLPSLKASAAPLVMARREVDPDQRTSRIERRGWLDDRALRMLGPFVAQQVKDIQPGDVRGPVVQDRFLFLAYCEARRGGGAVEFEDVEEELRRQVVRQRRAEARNAVMAELLGDREVILVAAE